MRMQVNTARGIDSGERLPDAADTFQVDVSYQPQRANSISTAPEIQSMYFFFIILWSPLLKGVRIWRRAGLSGHVVLSWLDRPLLLLTSDGTLRKVNQLRIPKSFRIPSYRAKVSRDPGSEVLRTGEAHGEIQLVKESCTSAFSMAAPTASESTAQQQGLCRQGRRCRNRQRRGNRSPALLKGGDVRIRRVALVAGNGQQGGRCRRW